MTKHTRRISRTFSSLVVLGAGLGVFGMGALLDQTGFAGASVGCDISNTSGATVTVTCPVGSNTWTVPTGITSAEFQVNGAAGGSASAVNGGPGGNGEELDSTLMVAPGDVYTVNVGASGGNGTITTGGIGGAPDGGNGACCIAPGGGGGGGSSSVALSGTTLLDAAGGGGGGGGSFTQAAAGGNGDAPSGDSGLPPGGGGIGGAADSSCALPTGGNGLGGNNGVNGGGGGGCDGGAGGILGGGGGGGAGFITSSATGTGFSSITNSGDGSVTIIYTIAGTISATGITAAYTSTAATSTTGTVSVTQPSGTNYGVELDIGTGGGSFTSRLADSTSNPSDTLSFNLFTDSSHTHVLGDGSNSTFVFTGTGDGTADPFTVYALVPAGQSVPAGTYTDTLTATTNGQISTPLVVTFTVTAPQVAPTITSADNTTFTIGTSFSFNVTTSGTPDVISITNSSFSGCTPTVLPTGISFSYVIGTTASIDIASNAPGTDAGSYTFCLNASNSVTPIATQTFTLTVNAAPPTPTTTTLTVAATPSTAVYGTPVTFTGTLSGGLTGADAPTGSISGDAWPLPNCNGSPNVGDPSFSFGSDNNVTSGNGTYTLGTQSPPVGTYHLNDFFGDTDGFNTSASSGCDAATLTVTPAPLLIKAPTETIPFGTTPNLTPTYQSFVNGDTAASLTTQPTCTTKATATSAPGTYKVTCSGAVDPNYAITYATGKITITVAPSTFTINDYLTKGVRTTTGVLGEVGIPSGAHGTVTFKIGTRVLCTITLTGQSNEPTTCFADLGMGFSGSVIATFVDTDGDYASSAATNQLHITF